jgi:hypothetical protein
MNYSNTREDNNYNYFYMSYFHRWNWESYNTFINESRDWKKKKTVYGWDVFFIGYWLNKQSERAEKSYGLRALRR